MVEVKLRSSSVSLRLATFTLVVAIILHIVGYVLPRWSVMKSVTSYNSFDLETSYHVGLWQDCICNSAFDQESCGCDSKVGTTGNFKSVQALESVGLVGLTLSGIFSTLIILFLNQEKPLKTINIITAFGSGVCIVAGIIQYAVVCNDDYNELFNFIKELLGELGPSTNPARLNTSFILCTVAGGVALLLCTALLILDHRTTATPTDKQGQTVPVQFSNQGNVASPAHIQVTTNNASQQHGLTSLATPESTSTYTGNRQETREHSERL